MRLLYHFLNGRIQKANEQKGVCDGQFFRKIIPL